MNAPSAPRSPGPNLPGLALPRWTPPRLTLHRLTLLRLTLFGLTALGLLAARGSVAGMVTVDVKLKSGAAAEDTIVVFDPIGTTVPPGHDAAVIDQINKRFVPRVSVVRTGTVITFPNSDHIRHQVFSFSPAKTFTLKLYAGSPKTDVVFDHAGLVVLGCNIHDTMVAFVGVVDSPYFAKIPASGKSTLDLPAGRYRLRVWHPALTEAIPPRDITVSTPPTSIPLTIALDESRETVMTWPE